MSERLRKLVERLHKKSKAGELAWQKAPSGAFQISFPMYTVSLDGPRTPAGTPMTIMTIYNQKGDILEQVKESDLVFDDPYGDNRTYSNKMKETYELARRRALGTDKAIEELLAALED